jgi:hypothetical protein
MVRRATLSVGLIPIRKTTMPLPLAPLFIASQLLITVADSVPQLNVRTSCSAANRGGGATQDMNNCLQEEQLARTQLVKDWGQYAAADRSGCVELSTMGGSPSYVELLTCLEMAKAAKESPAQLGARDSSNVSGKPHKRSP